MISEDSVTFTQYRQIGPNPLLEKYNPNHNKKLVFGPFQGNRPMYA
jgi:hypothetical protein